MKYDVKINENFFGNVDNGVGVTYIQKFYLF